MGAGGGRALQGPQAGLRAGRRLPGSALGRGDASALCCALANPAAGAVQGAAPHRAHLNCCSRACTPLVLVEVLSALLEGYITVGGALGLLRPVCTPRCRFCGSGVLEALVAVRALERLLRAGCSGAADFGGRKRAPHRVQRRGFSTAEQWASWCFCRAGPACRLWRTGHPKGRSAAPGRHLCRSSSTDWSKPFWHTGHLKRVSRVCTCW